MIDLKSLSWTQLIELEDEISAERANRQRDDNILLFKCCECDFTMIATDHNGKYDEDAEYKVIKHLRHKHGYPLEDSIMSVERVYK